MAHNINWYHPGEVLFVEITGDLTLDELDEINANVIHLIESQREKLNILIDARRLVTTYQSAKTLRDTQLYMNHARVNWGLIVAENKLVRLVTLMAFSTARVKILQFQSLDTAEKYLQRMGYFRQNEDISD